MNAPRELSVTVDERHPWLGLASFDEDTRSWFHGREDEVAELARRVQRKLLTVLFGQSGLGKTSILRAGVVPLLRQAAMCPVYLRIDYAGGAPLPREQVKQAIVQAASAAGNWARSGTALPGESLWEFLHHRDDMLRDAHGQVLTPLLVFDQFEEVFTLAQGDADGRARASAFLDELADLVENRPPRALEERIDADEGVAERFDFARSDYRVLIALREDYLAHLEALKQRMPAITQNRMRLARMNGAQALQAVLAPAGKLATRTAAEAIVRFVSGASELADADVEPALLSLICRELNNARIAQGHAEISAELLAGSHAGILGDFYERALADQPEAVRRAIEDELLTEAGYRENIAEARLRRAFEAAGAAPDALDRLVERRLLRIEERLDVRRVELTHDVLCSVVSASAALRREREARELAERQRAQEAELATHTRAQLRRARKVALVCAVLTAGAIGSAAYGYVNAQRAQQAEQRAAATRDMSDQARAQAESLLSFLLDDFQAELEPQGRLELLASVAGRVVTYYDGLPTGALTPEAERNRALAQMRLGTVQASLGNDDVATKVLDQAISTLQRLHGAGDQTERTLIGLVRALRGRASVFMDKTKYVEMIGTLTMAKQVCHEAPPGVRALPMMQRTCAQIAVSQGYAQYMVLPNETALASLVEARTMLTPWANAEPGNTAAAESYLYATGWLVATLVKLQRFDEARLASKEGMVLADQLVERYPSNKLSRSGRSALAGITVEALGMSGEQEPAESLRLTRISMQDQKILMAGDPNNAKVQTNLQVSHMFIAISLRAMGNMRAALEATQAAISWPVNVQMTSFTAANIDVIFGDGAFWATELGQDARADVFLRQATALGKKYGMGDAQRANNTKLSMALAEVQVALLRGDFQRAANTLAMAGQFKPGPVDAGLLVNAQRLRSELELRQQHYAAAAAAASQVEQSQLTRREAAQVQTTLAISLAAQGKNADAVRALEPVLALRRSLHLVGDADYQFEYAQLLYARALCEPGQAASLLAQAIHELDTLPADMRTMRTVALWRGWIDKEAGHHQ